MLNLLVEGVTHAENIAARTGRSAFRAIRVMVGPEQTPRPRRALREEHSGFRNRSCDKMNQCHRLKFNYGFSSPAVHLQIEPHLKGCA